MLNLSLRSVEISPSLAYFVWFGLMTRCATAADALVLATELQVSRESYLTGNSAAVRVRRGGKIYSFEGIGQSRSSPVRGVCLLRALEVGG